MTSERDFMVRIFSRIAMVIVSAIIWRVARAPRAPRNTFGGR